MNILVYSGPEVVQRSLDSTISLLKSLLPNYSIQRISQQSLVSHPWSSTCPLLVFPERSDPQLSPAVIASITTHLENGRAFLTLALARDSSAGFDLDILDVLRAGKSLPLQVFDKTTHEYVSAMTNGSGQPDTRSLAGCEGEIFAVRCDIGAGKAILWGRYPSCDSEISPTSSFTYPFVSTTHSSPDDERRKLMQATLQGIGLIFPSQSLPITSPLPQFLVSDPVRPSAALQAMADASSSDLEISVFKDANDSFIFHKLTEGTKILNQCRESSEASHLTTHGTTVPNHVIVCAGELPPPECTPLFDIRTYFTALAAMRNDVETRQSECYLGMGEILMYGEVVTSTQTILNEWVFSTFSLSSLLKHLLETLT
jgi:biotin---protein ligase